MNRCSAIREDGAIFPTIADEVTERYSIKEILSLRLTSNFQVFKLALGKLHHLPFTPITEAMFLIRALQLLVKYMGATSKKKTLSWCVQN